MSSSNDNRVMIIGAGSDQLVQELADSRRPELLVEGGRGSAKQETINHFRDVIINSDYNDIEATLLACQKRESANLPPVHGRARTSLMAATAMTVFSGWDVDAGTRNHRYLFDKPLVGARANKGGTNRCKVKAARKQRLKTRKS